MTIDQCVVGTRVVCVAPFDGAEDCVGLHGVIKRVYETAIYVEFDTEFTGGWDLYGLAMEGRGRIGNAACLELEQDEICACDFLNVEIGFDSLG